MTGQIGSKPFYIFGTGYVADAFYRALKMHRMTDEVRGFVISHHKEGAVFHGLPVMTPEVMLSADKANKCAAGGSETAVMAAVHEAVLPEVMRTLKKAGVDKRHQITWIAPEIPEMLYGRPLREKDRLPLRDILNRQDRDDYWLAVRFGAYRRPDRRDDDQDVIDPAGGSIYIKAISQFSTEASAKHRLTFFAGTIRSIEKNGFDPDRPALIDENGRIIDGLHRIALAKHLGAEELSCTVYPASPVYDEVITAKTRLHESVLADAGLTVEEERILKENQSRLLEGF